MLQDCIEIFETKYREKGERFILDNYELSPGTYRLVLIEDEALSIIETVDIKRINKEENQGSRISFDLYFQLKFYDYYSKLLEMNKPIDPKKIIHSNNYMAFAVKKASIKEGKVGKEAVERYFCVLKDPCLKYKKGKTAEIYRDFESREGAPDADLVEKIEEFILTGKCWADIDCDGKDYLKIFFVFSDEEKTKEIYRREGERYLMPNLYNSNDYNVSVEGSILGLPNNNMGMNSKKPYLANRTRKVETPYLLDQKNAKLQNLLFDYLSGSLAKGRANIYFADDGNKKNIIAVSDRETPGDFSSGYYMRLSQGKSGAEIIKFSTVSEYEDRLEPHFVLKNFLSTKIDTEKQKLPYGEFIEKLSRIKELIDRVLFNGYLTNSFFNDPKDINVRDEPVVKECILESRDALHNWFYTGQKENVGAVLKKVSWKLIKSSFSKDNGVEEARRRGNLRWSIMNYFDNNERMWERMGDVREKLRYHINSKEEWKFEDGRELSYAIGQAVGYLLSKSKADKKRCSFINPFLNSRDLDNIKRRLLQLYKKYDYDIYYMSNSRIRKLTGSIFKVNAGEFEIYPDFIAAGFMDEQLVYENDNKEGGKEYE